MLDVKFQFVQLDRLSKRKASERSELEEHAPKNLEWKMIKRCREAVDLHQKVYKYVLTAFRKSIIIIHV